MMRFHFPEPPFPKERPRMGKYGAYTPQKTADFERKIARHAREQMIAAQWERLDCGIDVRFVFNFAKPKTTKRDFPTKGDIDNYIKSVADALNGVVWKDDRMIASLSAVKQWSPTQDPYITLHVNRV